MVACTQQVGDREIVSQSEYLAGPWQMPADVAQIAAEQYVAYEPTPAYRSGAGCLQNGQLFPGIERLSDYVTTYFEGVTHVWNAVYCKASNGVMSQHGMGKAADLMITPVAGDADNERGDRIANWLATNAMHLGVMRIIWDDSSWTAERGTINTGNFGHQDHIHVELNDAGTQAMTPWFTERGDEQPPGAARDRDWAADFEELNERAQRAFWLRQPTGSRATLSASFRNMGTQAWRTGEVQLAALNPRDGGRSDIMTPRWVSASRITSLTQDVLPGEVARFDFEVLVPDSTTDLYLGLVAQGREETFWFGEFGGPERHDSVFVVIEPSAASHDAGCRTAEAKSPAGLAFSLFGLLALISTIRKRQESEKSIQ